MSSRVCATGHMKDPMPLIEKSRASCPDGRFVSCGNKCDLPEQQSDVTSLVIIKILR